MQMKILTVTALIISLCFAGTAAATPVYVTETGVQPGTGVSIQMLPYFNSVNAATGEYQITIDSSGSWNGNYSGFCVDPAYSGPRSLYDLRAVPEGSNYEAAAWLFNKYGSAVTGVYNTTLAMNIQLAVWELVMDGVNGTTTTGNFQVLNNAVLANSSQAYVTEALNNFNAAAFDQSAFHLLVNPTQGSSYGLEYQDYMIYKAVPEPISMLLLGMGLIGVATFRRLKG